jgi:hypothetical protein
MTDVTPVQRQAAKPQNAHHASQASIFNHKLHLPLTLITSEGQEKYEVFQRNRNDFPKVSFTLDVI